VTEPAPLRELPAWGDLQAHYEKIRGAHLRELFAADRERGERLVADGGGAGGIRRGLSGGRDRAQRPGGDHTLDDVQLTLPRTVVVNDGIVGGWSLD